MSVSPAKLSVARFTAAGPAVRNCASTFVFVGSESARKNCPAASAVGVVIVKLGKPENVTFADAVNVMKKRSETPPVLDGRRSADWGRFIPAGAEVLASILSVAPAGADATARSIEPPNPPAEGSACVAAPLESAKVVVCGTVVVEPGPVPAGGTAADLPGPPPPQPAVATNATASPRAKNLIAGPFKGTVQ